MTHTGKTRLVEAVTEALELHASERATFMDRLRAEKPELGAEVARLLARHDRGSRELPTPPEAGAVPPGLDPDQDPLVGRALGDFTLVRLIEAGGMGRVYEGRQGSPARRVAVKVLAQRYLRGPAFRRFTQEAHILGSLEHPSICRVFAAGSALLANEAVPYIAMEYVDGRGLLEAAAGLELRQRLELLVQVCDAVEFAHQKGVIHRDLKPGNVLVEDHSAGGGTGADGARGQTGPEVVPAAAAPRRGETQRNHGDEPRVKVLDFGVAKVLLDGPSDQAQRTVTGHVVGTLHYMSPEQAAGVADIDARSDVYSLGVMLYELVSGARPWAWPSTASAPGSEFGAEEAPRLGELNSAWRGDLERIAAKALERDRASRYSSAAALADDLRRYLMGEPIAARPRTMLDQLRRLRRRHRTGFTAALAVTGTMTLGIAGLIWQNRVHERTSAPASAAAAFSAYSSAVQAANAALRADDVGAAQAELASAEPSLRGWEWWYLAGTVDQSREVWRIAGLEAVTGLREAQGRLQVLSGERVRTVDLSAKTLVPGGGLIEPAVGTGAAGLEDGAVVVTDRSGLVLEGAWAGVRAGCAAISQDGRWAAAGVGDRVHLWDVRTGQQASRLRGHAAAVTAVTFGTDSLWSGSADGLIRRWDIATKADPELITRGDIQSHPPGGFFGWFDGAHGALEVGEPGAATPWARVEGIRGAPWRTALSADRRVLVTAGLDAKGSLAVWDLTRGTSIVAAQNYLFEDNVLSLDAAGTRAALAGNSGVVHVISLPEATPFAEIRVGGKVETAEFSPDGSRLAVSYWPAGLRVYRLSDGALLTECDTRGTMPIATVYSADGRWLASLNNLELNLNLWDAATGRLERRVLVDHPMYMTRIGDTGRLAVGSWDGAVRVYPFDLPPGAPWTPLLTLWERSECACNLIAARNGSALVAKLTPAAALVWRVRTPSSEVVVNER